jgi:hypothetical protein
MDLQDPKVQRLLVSVLLSGLVLFGFFGMSYLPFSYPARNAKITTMENEYEKVSDHRGGYPVGSQVGELHSAAGVGPGLLQGEPGERGAGRWLPPGG